MPLTQVDLDQKLSDDLHEQISTEIRVLIFIAENGFEGRYAG